MATTEVGTDQRQAVVEAAAALFAERGFDSVTMAEVAEAGGVARATVFNYFGSKGALLEAITESVVGIWVEMLDDALADTATPAPGRLRQLCAEMGSGIEGQQALHREVFREIARIQVGIDAGETGKRMYDLAGARLLALMEQGQARGELTTQLTASAMANAFHSLTTGTINTWLYHDQSDALSACLADAVEVFLAPVEHVAEDNGERYLR
jgi:AcrR family transcriptional regulator